MNDRMSDERLAEIYAKDLRTHVDPDLDDIIDELLTALKAEREAIERVKALIVKSERKFKWKISIHLLREAINFPHTEDAALEGE